MKNLRYIPFMRNRYFEGKLLTAEDFAQEQRYMNDKRRLHNRYFHGVGVVAGLEVIRVDDYSVSLEAGVAIDGAGREIVVETPSIYKLSMLAGFETATGRQGGESLKLYIAYGEEDVEPVHNMAERSVHTQEEPDYNKIQERYQLYVTGDEPVLQEDFSAVDNHVSFISTRSQWIDRLSGSEGICLAKIELIKAGEFYMIEKLEPMYGGQYAGCVPYLEGRLYKLERELALQKETDPNGEEAKKQPMAPNKIGSFGEGLDGFNQKKKSQGGEAFDNGSWQLARGSVRIPLEKRGRRGQTVFSEEIAHGLGLGAAELFLQVQSGDAIYGGAGDVFPREEMAAACAYRLHRSKGTFVIGVRLLSEIVEAFLTVNWTALRNRKREEVVKEEKRLYIDPPMVNVRVRGEAKLNAVSVNGKAGKLIWSVSDPAGGIVDEDGLYHAPDHPGVFEITASVKEEGLRACLFAVVREL